MSFILIENKKHRVGIKEFNFSYVDRYMKNDDPAHFYIFFAVVFLSPFQNFPMPTLSRIFTGYRIGNIAMRYSNRNILFIPRTAVLMSPFQNFQISIFSGSCTSQYIPRAAVLTGPFQNFEMPILSGICTSPFIPRAAVLMSPFQNFQISTFSGSCTSQYIPRAA